MNEFNEVDRRRIVGKFYSENKHLGKAHTVAHFLRLNLKQSSIYCIIRRIEKNMTLERKVGSGRSAIKMPNKKVESLKNSIIGKLCVSQRKLAKRFNISRSYLQEILRTNGIQYFKRQVIPKTTEKQRILQKKRLIKLSKGKLQPNNGLEVVMDDESYFPMSGHKIPGNDGYYANDKSNVDSHVKHRTKEKFPKKVLIWIAISSKGCSKPYFAIKN